MFTLQEIEVLIKAIDAWKTEPMTDGLSMAILGAALGGGKKDKEQQAEDFSNSLKKSQDESKSREETAVLIKAKLIQMRNELGGSEIVREANIFLGGRND